MSQAEIVEVMSPYVDPSWGVRWPYIEDVICNSHLCAFFVQHRHMDLISPEYSEHYHKAPCALAAGRQSGVMNSKAALEPLLTVCGDPASHFIRSSGCLRQDFILRDANKHIDSDANFAIAQSFEHEFKLWVHRQACALALSVLAERLHHVNCYIIALLKSSVSAVASNMHFALIIVLMALAKWPGFNLARRFVTGFQPLWLEASRVLIPKERNEILSRDALAKQAVLERGRTASRCSDDDASVIATK